MNGRRFQFNKESSKAGTVELKKADGFAAGEHLECFFVIKRNVFNVDVDLLHGFDASNCIGKDGKVFNTEKVEFKKACILDRVHVVLADNFLFALGVVLKRRKIGQRTRRNNHTGGVDGDVPGTAFDFLCEVDDAFYVFFIFVHRSEFGNVGEGALDGHRKTLRAERNELGNTISHFIAVAKCAGVTSFTDPRAIMVPKVPICATLFVPYLRRA